MSTQTTNYKFMKPDQDEFYDIDVQNENWDEADAQLNVLADGKLDGAGDASNVINTFAQATARENLKTGEKLSASLGKLMKWFADLKAVAFSGKASDVSQDATHRMVTDSEKTVWNGKAGTSTATPAVNGLMSKEDKAKLDRVAAGANNYVHPSTDGNKHVPVTGTSNNGRLLQAGAAAGSMSWAEPSKSMVGLSNVDNTSDADKPVSVAQQKALDKKVTSAGGDIADTKISAFTGSSASYPVPAANDTVKVGFGKIKKFFEDIRNAATGACFIGQIVNNCVTNNAKLPLSAAQGKALMDLYTKLNSEINKQYAIAGAAFVTDFNHAMAPGRYRVYNESGAVAHGPYSGHIGGYVDIVTDGDAGTAGTKIYQELHDHKGDTYVRVIVAGSDYGAWEKHIDSAEFSKWKFIVKYIEIPANQNYWYGDEAMVKPGTNEQNNPILVLTSTPGIVDLYAVKAWWSEYGTLGVQINRATASNASMVISILYLDNS